MENLHIALLEKFIPPYMDFVAEYFDVSRHHFVFIGKPDYKYGLTKEHPVEWLDDLQRATELLEKAKRIIIHCLWSEEIIRILCSRPYLLKKCFWIMWGADYYFPEQHSNFKKYVIKHMRYMTSWGSEYQYVVDNYGVSGTFLESILYPYVIYKDMQISEEDSESVTIQLGNSADPTNNHLAMLESLVDFRDRSIKLVCPLSYSGTPEYIDLVVNKGRRLFGEKFVPLLDYIPREDYLRLWTETGIALFNHNRQQAMGNILNLLNFGKKVYIAYKPVRDFLISVGFRVFDPAEFSLIPLGGNEKSENIEAAKKYLSKERYLEHLQTVFSLPVD